MALRFAERYPELLDGLIFIDSTAGQHPEDEIEQYGEMLEATRNAGKILDDQVDIVKQLLFGETTLKEKPDLAQEWVDRMLTYPAEAVYQEVYSWLERPDFTANLHDIDVPALVIHGEEDVGLEPARSDSLVEHLDARRVMIPNAGHTSNLENPAPVNEAIREFLESVH